MVKLPDFSSVEGLGLLVFRLKAARTWVYFSLFHVVALLIHFVELNSTKHTQSSLAAHSHLQSVLLCLILFNPNLFYLVCF